MQAWTSSTKFSISSLGSTEEISFKVLGTWLISLLSSQKSDLHILLWLQPCFLFGSNRGLDWNVCDEVLVKMTSQWVCIRFLVASCFPPFCLWLQLIRYLHWLRIMIRKVTNETPSLESLVLPLNAIYLILSFSWFCYFWLTEKRLEAEISQVIRQDSPCSHEMLLSFKKRLKDNGEKWQPWLKVRLPV